MSPRLLFIPKADINNILSRNVYNTSHPFFMSTYKPNLLIVASNKTCTLHLKFVSFTIKIHFRWFESLVVTSSEGNLCVPFADVMALSLYTFSRFISPRLRTDCTHQQLQRLNYSFSTCAYTLRLVR